MNGLLLLRKRALQADDTGDAFDYVPSQSPTTETGNPTSSPTPLAELWGNTGSPEQAPYRRNPAQPNYASPVSSPYYGSSGSSPFYSNDDDGGDPSSPFIIVGIFFAVAFLLSCLMSAMKNVNRDAVVSANNPIYGTSQAAAVSANNPIYGTSQAAAVTTTNGTTGRPQNRSTAPTERVTLPTTPREEADLVKSMTREQRREYVANFLLAEKFAGQERSDSERSGSFTISQSKRNISSDDLAPSCAICLEVFADGEDICTSQNKHCPHQFHLVCAFDWLLTSQECPCCRRNYLSIDQPSSNRRNTASLSSDPVEVPFDALSTSNPVVPQGLTPSEILARSIQSTQLEF